MILGLPAPWPDLVSMRISRGLVCPSDLLSWSCSSAMSLCLLELLSCFPVISP